MGYTLLSAEMRVKQRPVGFASSGFLAMVLGASWSRRWHLSYSVHGPVRCILEDADQTQVCSTATSESEDEFDRSKNLEFPKGILVFAAPCQGLRAAVATQGILYSAYVHE